MTREEIDIEMARWAQTPAGRRNAFWMRYGRPAIAIAAIMVTNWLAIAVGAFS